MRHWFLLALALVLGPGPAAARYVQQQEQVCTPQQVCRPVQRTEQSCTTQQVCHTVQTPQQRCSNVQHCQNVTTYQQQCSAQTRCDSRGRCSQVPYCQSVPHTQQQCSSQPACQTVMVPSQQCAPQQNCQPRQVTSQQCSQENACRMVTKQVWVPDPPPPPPSKPIVVAPPPPPPPPKPVVVAPPPPKPPVVAHTPPPAPAPPPPSSKPPVVAHTPPPAPALPPPSSKPPVVAHTPSPAPAPPPPPSKPPVAGLTPPPALASPVSAGAIAAGKPGSAIDTRVAGSTPATITPSGTTLAGTAGKVLGSQAVQNVQAGLDVLGATKGSRTTNALTQEIASSINSVTKAGVTVSAVTRTVGNVGNGLGVVTGSYGFYQDVRAGKPVSAGFDAMSVASSAAGFATAAPTSVVGRLSAAGGVIEVAQTVLQVRNDFTQGHVVEGLSNTARAAGQAASGGIGVITGYGFSAGVSGFDITQAVGQGVANQFLVPYMVKHLNDQSSWVGRLNSMLPQ